MKTQPKLLSDLDQDLIKTVAGQVMGWTVLEKYAEVTNNNATYFFLDEGRPIKGTTYPHNFVLIEHGIKPYGIQWKLWNPLTDPAAREEVIDKLIEGGENQITLIRDGKSTHCHIHNFKTEIGRSARSEMAGQAICQAAIKFSEAMINDGDNGVAWDIARPLIDEQIEVYSPTINEWLPCTYREGGTNCYLHFDLGGQYTYDDLNEDSFSYPKWRRVLGSTEDQIGDKSSEGYTDMEDQASDDYQEPDDYTDPEPTRFDGSLL